MQEIQKAAQAFMDEHGGGIDADHLCPEQRGTGADGITFSSELLNRKITGIVYRSFCIQTTSNRSPNFVPALCSLPASVNP